MPTIPAQVPRDGSTAYYSLLYCNDDVRTRYMQTLQLIQTISTTLFDVSEPQVAEQKVHWWHEEIARMAKRQSSHPACQVTEAYLHGKSGVKACMAILSSAANERYTPLATDSDLAQHVTEDYLARFTLLSVAAGVEQELPLSDKSADGDLALATGQWHRLNTLGLRLQHGYSVFSDEKFKARELNPEHLATKSTDKETQATKLLKSEIKEVHHQLKTAMVDAKHRPDSLLNRVLPLHVCAELRLAQLTMWTKHTPDLVGGTRALTPLKKFFIAYRSQRRFNRANIATANI